MTAEEQELVVREIAVFFAGHLPTRRSALAAPKFLKRGTGQRQEKN